MTASNYLKKERALPVVTELIARRGWIIQLRWTAVIAVVCTIEVARFFLGVELVRGPLYALVAGLALYNTVLFAIESRLKRTQASEFWHRPSAIKRFLVPRPFRNLAMEAEAYRTTVFAVAQMSIDLGFLASMLHFSGGVENPFAFFSIFHVIIASILMSRRATFLIASIAFSLISAVAIGECFGALRHYPLGAMWLPEIYRDPHWILAHLSVLGLTLYLSAFICSAISVRLRQREREIGLLSEELVDKAAALEEAYRSVSESERLKSQYMRKVAHEIRGPLATIQTALNVVLDGIAGELPEKSRDFIARAERRAAELSTVATDLLMLSRAKESRQQADLSVVKPATVVENLIEESKALAERSELKVSFESASDVGEVEVDVTGLQQLIGNLLGNAIRYTPKGGSVSVRMSKVGVSLRIEVKDSGIGIPEQDIPRVFDEFFRSTNARKHTHEGTGLGMAIVRAVVERHKGSISVESKVGSGTCFTVDLPLYAS
ncbi:MAG: HAMP domain-containing histidine kinase [Deltaproteobacteria bacterium]|nr:HAMP domain-containing histidine kinase [Deltaproteobacteria bacterium]